MRDGDGHRSHERDARCPLPGYDVRIVNGKHLAGTDHRVKALRELGGAPLPGHTVAVLNPHYELIEDRLACEAAAGFALRTEYVGLPQSRVV